LMKKICHKITNNIFILCRKIKNKRKKARLKNNDVTILCSDCIGGLIYNDFNMRFNSPTINLYIKPSDFIKFCKKLDFYLDSELKYKENKNHIVGMLADIEIHFLHYKTFEDAKNKWLERSKRINKDNICVILTCKDGYTLKDIKSFDKLNYKNKVVFVPKKYNNFDSSFYIKNSEENSEIKFLGTKVNHFGKKLIDNYDVVSFLNKCKESK